VELSREPFALSDLIGKPVRDGSGRRLGRVFEVRAHWEDGRIVFDEILVGRGSLLKRLRGQGAAARGIPWESVAELGEQIVVQGTTGSAVKPGKSS
jgi:sporulation protein YlmC with PRC-barrel domain